MTQRVLLRTSERRTYANCRQAWWWSYVEGWEANDIKPALRFGTLVHEALKAWYPPGRERGVKPWLAFEALYAADIEAGRGEFDVYNSEDEKSVDALDLGIEMLKNYVNEWGEDDHIEVICPEMSFAVDIYDKADKYMVTYVGSLDLVYKDLSLNQLGIIETKTAGSISTRHLGLDEQAGSYWTFAPEALQNAGYLKKGQDIDFILYNFLRKAFADVRPTNAAGSRLNKPSKTALLEACQVRSLELPKAPKIEDLELALVEAGIDPAQFGEVSKSQPPPLFERTRVYRDDADRENLLYRVKAQAWEMAQVKAGKLPVYKNPGGTFPNQQCSGCEFAEVCELHETGREWEELARLTMGRWDPYEDHSAVVGTAVPVAAPKRTRTKK